MPTHRDHPVILPSRARLPGACALALGLACSTSDGSGAADSSTGEVETSGSTRSDPADGTSTSTEGSSSDGTSSSEATSGTDDSESSDSGVDVDAPTIRLSVDDGGVEGNDASMAASISDDGQRIVFFSFADNLVADDQNGADDLFLRDVSSGTTVRLSENAEGVEADGGHGFPAISRDGRRVVFLSTATNYVIDDTNDNPDMFVRDLDSGTITRVSVNSTGAQGSISDPRVVGFDGATPAIAYNGDVVAFNCGFDNLVEDDTNGVPDVFVHDLESQTTVRASLGTAGIEGDGDSYSAAISGDGRRVAFASAATNLVEDDTNDRPDIFVHDLDTGETERVSVASDGTEANTPAIEEFGSQIPQISADGRWIAFQSDSSNLVANDTNDLVDIFVHDLDTGTTTRVSVNSAQEQALGGDTSFWPSISGDGRFVAFRSGSPNLVDDDTNEVSDVFVRDLVRGSTTRVSLTAEDLQANERSTFPVLSGDGRWLSFESDASDLVADDTNETRDVFRRGPLF